MFSNISSNVNLFYTTDTMISFNYTKFYNISIQNNSLISSIGIKNSNIVFELYECEFELINIIVFSNFTLIYLKNYNEIMLKNNFFKNCYAGFID